MEERKGSGKAKGESAFGGAQPSLSGLVQMGIGHKSKEYGRWGLYSAKAEIVLYELRQALYWQTIVELFLTFLCFLMLLTGNGFQFIFHFVHGIRPYFAYLTIQTLPKSYSILEGLPEDLKQVNQDIQTKLFDEFKYCSAPLTKYFIVSMCGLLLDLLTLLYDVKKMDGDELSAAFFLFAAFIYVSFDLFLPLWYYTLKFSFPEDIWVNLTKIANGTFEEATAYVKNSLDQMQQSLK
ncbi:unnamed protein product [Blepharisma stoltei]|uniref:Uncharacterized protein n=1 Tax=Blepharisma stoltei TaxID=1481888 RepID=A0AAU9K9P6_9CILI|nr:unnamed protein product [Blepharisma stoltei]